ncbi:hypothetical protein [Demequina aurantiaca]|uniref:hypothetical protein n=1 Tax=Demequina aurantiaca TaxID=676200 RepID=UPI003D334BF8
MRWRDLFSDLEGQLGAAADAQFAADVAERTRGERASIALGARLAAALGSAVVITLVDGESVSGTLSDSAATWVLVNEPRRQCWIPIAAVATVGGLAQRAVVVTAVARGLSVGHAMRALSRARAQVVVFTQAGQHVGVIGQVGADYLELAAREAPGPTAIPFASILRVVSAAADA